MTSTAQLLLEADRLRPRSQQREIGVSDLGSCRRRTGYKLAGTDHVNETGSVQAVIGSAVHDQVQKVLDADMPAGWLVEEEVTFAGILGHLDRYEADTETVVDVKTTSSRWLDHIKLHGPEHPHLWQVNIYAAALISRGTPVRRVRIDYLGRDSGEEYQWPNADGASFNPQHVRDALSWLKLVRDTPLSYLPRDYEPDSVFCQGCPFGGPDGGICWTGGVEGHDPLSVLYVEDPDLERWVADLWDAKRKAEEAKAFSGKAKGALDAVRPDVPNQRVAVGGWEIAWNINGVLRFTGTPDSVKRAA